MKALITLKQANSANENHFLLVVMAVAVVLLFSTPFSIKADFTYAHRLSSNGIKEGVVRSDDVFSEIPVISNNELGGMRGGFSVGGLDINIGAIVRTFIDGRLALQSQLTVANNGSIKNSITSPTSTGIPGAIVISKTGSGSSLQAVTPKGVNLHGLEGSEGIVINDNRGFTAVLQNIGKDRILSTIVNQSSGRKIQHKVDIAITINNSQQLQRAARSARLTHHFIHR
jgi:hypothetical protein